MGLFNKSHFTVIDSIFLDFLSSLQPSVMRQGFITPGFGKVADSRGEEAEINYSQSWTKRPASAGTGERSR